MNKKIFLIVFSGLLILMTNALNAQTNYNVSFDWDDSNCSECNSITKYAKVRIYTYPGNDFVCESDWEVVTGTSTTIYDNGDIRTDCTSDCYKVYAYVKYVDSNGICCEGVKSENCIGQDLYVGYSFEYDIIMN